MKTTIEELSGQLVDAITTVSDENAHELLMERTGQFLNMLEHCCRFHPGVVTPEFMGEVLGDLSHLSMQFDLPEPVIPH